MNIQANSAALLFALATSVSASAQTVLFADDFESAPNPVNLFYGAGGAIDPGTWAMANDGPQNEGWDASTNSYNDPAKWTGPLPASTYLQLAYAGLDATEPTIALMETWDATKNYTLSFDLANRDNVNYDQGLLEVNFFGVPLQLWAGATYLAANQYSAVFKNNPNDPDAGLISKVDIAAMHSAYSSMRLEVTVTGAEIAAAGQAGSQIYFSFDKGWNSEHHYIDNVEFTEFDPTLGSNYCTTNPNSTTLLGTISATGSDVAADNDFTLVGSQLPDGQFAYFLGSRTQGFTANPGGSAGNLCILGAIARFNRSGEVGAIAGGSFARLMPLGDFPEPSGNVAVMAGETWNFQCWHRDTAGGVPTSNFTNGLEVLFQ